METKRTIDLNDIPKDVIIAYILPNVLPELYVSSMDNEKNLYNAVQMVQNAVVQKKINNIALISKRFYKIIKLQYNLYDTLTKDIENNPKIYSLFELLSCFQFPQFVRVTFERETEWWQIEKEKSMKVKIEYNAKDTATYILILLHCESKYLPIEIKASSCMKKDTVKMCYSLKRFFDLVNSLGCYAGSKGYIESETQSKKRLALRYLFKPETTIPAQDAILICKLLHQFSLPPKKQNVIEDIQNAIEGIPEKFKNFFE